MRLYRNSLRFQYEIVRILQLVVRIHNPGTLLVRLRHGVETAAFTVGTPRRPVPKELALGTAGHVLELLL